MHHRFPLFLRGFRLSLRGSWAPLLLTLGIATPLGASADHHADAPAPARIVVTGSAELPAAPDLASFTATVSTEGRSADAVLDDNARRSARMLEALEGAGVDLEALQTQGVRLTPQWSPRPRNTDADWRPEIVGYSASNRVEVRTRDLEGVGMLLATAVEAGANGVDGVRFTLEDDSSVRNQVIEAATRRALEEARIMASAAGITPGAVLEMRLDHARTALPAPLMNARMEMASMDSSALRAMPMAAGTIEVTASVTLTLQAQ